ncbi:MAG: SET domain-containing protein-lysine N-methyltransferase [Sediminibacterium sp.]|jgi:D-alanine-D-alanine ligase-like ATP-grasp enzyme|nr:SET domain-containing protein-lysine N-methyltransferase [Sediminibacterium sp.]
MLSLPQLNHAESFAKLKIAVLQPDYSTSGVDYQYYDPKRDLSVIMPEATIDHIFLNKLSTYQQLKQLKEKKYDIYINLCEGYLEWKVPSIDVITSLDLLELPYTGPSANLYDPTKAIMKYLAFCESVKTPAHIVIESYDEIDALPGNLQFPLFVKPAKAGDSLGVDDASKANNLEDLKKKVKAILDEFGSALVEEYIDGREFTVLVCGNADGRTCTSFKPIEYIFPEGFAFKTYALKTSELHPNANISVEDKALSAQLQSIAEQVFLSFNGVGYARMDFRMNHKGEIFFLEINFTCSVFYAEGYEGSADYILMHDGVGKRGFLERIIVEGMARHQRKQKLFSIKGNSISGYGIYAKYDLPQHTLLFKGEERAQRIVTKKYVDEHWDEREKLNFRRYAYPISKDTYILWDLQPEEWSPQNHSCDANCEYQGLNVVTNRNIQKGEELTLDYAQFLDHTMEPFECQCGSAKCRGLIRGKQKNSL